MDSKMAAQRCRTSMPEILKDNIIDALQRSGYTVIEFVAAGEHGCHVGTGTSAEGWIDTMVEFFKNS